jgi:hypothetical protein
MKFKQITLSKMNTFLKQTQETGSLRFFKVQLANVIPHLADFKVKHKTTEDKDCFIEEFEIKKDGCNICIGFKTIKNNSNMSLGQFNGSIRDINQLDSYVLSLLGKELLSPFKAFLLNSWTHVSSNAYIDSCLGDCYGSFTIFNKTDKTCLYCTVSD